MSYNYSPAYLRAHKDLVNKLVALADSDAQASLSFNTADEARAWRFTVNNCLACLARNQPALAYVRNRVRTWVTWANERYTVNVGVPSIDQKLKGPRPSAVERDIPLAASVSSTQYGNTLRIAEPITPESWPAISLKLAGALADKAIGTVVIEHSPEPAGIKYIAERMEPDFELRQATPQLILVRVG